MLLFKPEHVERILNHRKTQTRRLWKSPRVKVGNVYQARTRMLDKASTFAMLRVLRVWEAEDLESTSLADARAEGYNSVEEYIKVFREINRNRSVSGLYTLYAVEFEVANATA